MRWLDLANRRRAAAIALCAMLGAVGGCGSNTPGRMEWVQPRTAAPRVGNVYLIRGWQGIYSAGIDAMTKQLTAQGVTAHAYMPEQFPELAKAMVERYRNDPRHEPIVLVGHSRGVDAALLIARELDRAGIPVDMIVSLDSVDETTVPKNVRVCHNYWMPGFLYGTNLLRGIPLKQAPGSTGKLYNYDLSGEYASWRGVLTEHVSLDDDTKVQKRIVSQILEACPERSQWSPGTPVPTSNTPQR